MKISWSSDMTADQQDFADDFYGLVTELADRLPQNVAELERLHKNGGEVKPDILNGMAARLRAFADDCEELAERADNV